MGWQIKNLSEHPIIEIIYSGTLSSVDLFEAAIGALELGKKLETFNFLADCRNLSGGHTLFDLYDLSDDTANFFKTYPAKEALLLPSTESNIDKVRFWETTCINRGMNVKIFNDRDSAIAWLLGDKK
jgi:hypothetical protein